MAKTEQVNIRFDVKTDQKLTKTSEKLGCSRGALVRRLTEVFLDQVEKTGSPLLNGSWTAALGKADGRTKWGGRKGEPKPLPVEDTTKHTAIPCNISDSGNVSGADEQPKNQAPDSNQFSCAQPPNNLRVPIRPVSDNADEKKAKRKGDRREGGSGRGR